MTPKAERALRKSIQKWVGIAAGIEVDRAGRNCSLCQAFPRCTNCPIKRKTGQVECHGTPYWKWRHPHDGNKPLFVRDFDGGYWRPSTDAHFAAAREMVAFLIGLLPKKSKRKP